MTNATEQRKLAAIMFTDMVGYSALSQRHGNLALELLEEHRQLLREIFPRFHGSEIKTIGDAFLIEFNSALEAAQCAIEIQRTLAKRNHDVTADRRIELKIGIHIGDVVHRGGDVYGDGVNIASRIEPLAGAGGICVSMDVERQIRNALEARFEKLAPTELKNISVPMELFRIVLPWEKQLPRAASQSPISPPGALKWIWAAVAAVLLLIVGVGWWWTTLPRKSPAEYQAVSRTNQGANNIPEKSIAVLPFENLSANQENAFFTDGVQDEILTDLAKVADLKVISRTSVMQYKAAAPRNLSQIAQALKVANVLEGSVQRSANRVRVSAQLIDARTDTHIWAENYDRDLSDVFTIQSEIAQAIADQLRAKLSSREKAAIEERPTNDLVAYELYIRSKKLRDEETLSQSHERSNILEGIQLLNEAIARDPRFLLAHCLLALAQDTMYFNYDRTPERLALAEASIKTAENLQPAAGETHLAKGRHYYMAYLDYNRGREELVQARQTLPNNSEIAGFLGFINRRQGRWEEAVQEMKRAIEVDPNAGWQADLGSFYVNLRQYRDAAEAYDRHLAVHPTSITGRVNRALIDFHAAANLAPARATLKAIEEADPAAATELSESAFMVALRERDPVAATRAVAAMSGQSRESLSFPTAFCEAGVALLRHDAPAMHAAFLAAREQEERLVLAQPKNSEPLGILAWIDAYLGDKKKAIQEARAACDMTPLSKDALGGAQQQTILARVYTLTGERQLALEQLTELSKIPGGPSYGELTLDPEWDSLRGDPQFQKVVTSLGPTSVIGSSMK